MDRRADGVLGMRDMNNEWKNGTARTCEDEVNDHKEGRSLPQPPS